MNKLKLHIDDLAVESFQASPAPAADAGTVHGHVEPTDPDAGTCITYTCECGTDYGCYPYEGGTMRNCTYAPTMNPMLFDCYSLAYCVATKPCP
jgi:hypothetical protein